MKRFLNLAGWLVPQVSQPALSPAALRDQSAGREHFQRPSYAEVLQVWKPCDTAELEVCGTAAAPMAGSLRLMSWVIRN